jgi:hypothetical protein
MMRKSYYADLANRKNRQTECNAPPSMEEDLLTGKEGAKTAGSSTSSNIATNHKRTLAVGVHQRLGRGQRRVQPLLVLVCMDLPRWSRWSAYLGAKTKMVFSIRTWVFSLRVQRAMSTPRYDAAGIPLEFRTGRLYAV